MAGPPFLGIEKVNGEICASRPPRVTLCYTPAHLAVPKQLPDLFHRAREPGHSFERYDMPEADVTLDRLEDQISWYDRRSKYNQQMFKLMKTATIVISISIPLFAAFAAYRSIDGKLVALITGAVGATIALLEALQQLNQYQQQWITYRSTAEGLKHEKFLFLALAGPYAAAEHPGKLLAERVESLVSQEHAKWASTQEQTGKTDPKK